MEMQNNNNVDIKTVLIVEDDKDYACLLEDYISLLGHNSLSAANGREALELIDEANPDLVLLDIMMPEINGVQVLEKLNASNRISNLPVIVITAVNNKETLLECIRLGATDFLQKPFDSVLLRARIEACLEKKVYRDNELKLRKQLQEGYKSLTELEEMRDMLVHMIVHDLKNPLGLVRSYLFLILEHLEDAEKIDVEELKEFALTARQTAAQMTDLIEDILDVSKMESRQMETYLNAVDVVALAQGIYNEFQVQSKMTQADFTFSYDSKELLARADEGILSRVLQNLLTNAFKYSAKKAQVKFTVEQSDGGVLISIADNGPGIPEAFQDVIFDKYRQMEVRQKARGNGVGLGLTFCKMAVEAQQGRIWVESHEGQGAKFCVELKTP